MILKLLFWLFLFICLLLLITGGILYIINQKFHIFNSFSEFILIILGVGLAMVLAILFIYLMYLIDSLYNEVTGYLVFFTGGAQLVYITPLALLLIHYKQYYMMTGIIIGAAVVILLNIYFVMFILPNLKFGW